MVHLISLLEECMEDFKTLPKYMSIRAKMKPKSEISCNVELLLKMGWGVMVVDKRSTQ